MAYVTKRRGRYTGYYRDAEGQRRSAGTYTTREEALFRARDKEGTRYEVVPTPDTNPAAEQRYLDYALSWLAAERDLMPSTKRGYESSLRNHVFPYLGQLKVKDIKKDQIKDWVIRLQDSGVSGQVIQRSLAAVGSSLEPLVPDVLPTKPTAKVKVKAPAPPPFNLLEPEEIKSISAAMRTEGLALFTTYLAVTGCRYGEAIEARVKDLLFRTNEVSVSRRVSAGKSEGRVTFVVVSGTKAGEDRARLVPVPKALMTRLKAWITKNGLTTNDLLFPRRLVLPPDMRQVDDPVETDTSSFVGKDGRDHRHGTSYGYTNGGCRCASCLKAVRESRRKPGSRTRQRGTDQHLSHEVFRKHWVFAVTEAGLDWMPRPHDLRHANATQLIAEGVSIYEVQQRLGHRQLTTTEKYLHRVKKQKSNAAAAVAAFI